MEPHVLLKLEAAYGASTARILRNYERKASQKAAKTKQNYPSWAMQAAELSSDRQSQKKHNRAVHLARAFLKGTPYRVVEISTREGNSPKAEDIFDRLYVSGATANLGFVKTWLNSDSKGEN